MSSNRAILEKMLLDAGASAEALHGLDWLLQIADSIEIGKPLAWDARKAWENKTGMEYAACALVGYALGRIPAPVKREREA